MGREHWPSRRTVSRDTRLLYCHRPMSTREKLATLARLPRLSTFKARASKNPSAARTPSNTRVYAVGDIHGCTTLLDVLHILIEEDAKPFTGQKHIVYLGDFIDRGPDSKGVIDRLLDRVPSGFDGHHLRGNHDVALLTFLADPKFYRVWRSFGGADTLLSYGVRPPLPHAVDQIYAARDELQHALPARHLEFLKALPLTLVLGDYLFVHAGIRPGLAIEHQAEDDLLWIREPFLSSDADHGKVVVHGHTPVERPQCASNRISVDTGAYATGVLTCAVLEEDSCRFLQTQNP